MPNEQLPLPFVAEPRDPAPRPDRRQAVPVERKPAQREASVQHPIAVPRSA